MHIQDRPWDSMNPVLANKHAHWGFFSHSMCLQDSKFLTFANIPPPAPPPWIEQHALLQQALQTYLHHQQDLLPGHVHAQLTSALGDLSLEWYISIMSRLHVNCFRCDFWRSPYIETRYLLSVLWMVLDAWHKRLA